MTTRTTEPSPSRARWEIGDYAAVGSRILALSEELCETADLSGRSRVLDVACGHGNTALCAARRGCDVVGVDIVPSLLETARVRAEAERLPVDFREGDALALDLPGDSFDVTMSSFGVQFVPDQERAATELVRVTRPGGRIALGAWCRGPFWEMFPALLARYAPPPPGAPSPLRWGTEAGLRELFGDAPLRIESRTFRLRHRSARLYAEQIVATYPPLVGLTAAIGPEASATFIDEVEAVADDLNEATDGSLILPMTWIVALIDVTAETADC